MFIEIIHLEVGDGGHATLREIGVCLFKSGFANQSHAAVAGRLQRKAHAGDARTHYQIIIFVDHCFLCGILKACLFVVLIQLRAAMPRQAPRLLFILCKVTNYFLLLPPIVYFFVNLQTFQARAAEPGKTITK